MRVFIRFSSIRSRCLRIDSLFSSAFMLVVLSVGIVNSIGITASIPYTKLNGVSCVAVRIVVLYDQRTFCNSSAQLPPACVRRRLIPLTMVWLVTSTWPFDCGCATDVKFYLIFISLHQSLKGLSANCLPLSLIIVCGTPYRHTTCLQTNFMMFRPDMIAIASASTHFVK